MFRVIERNGFGIFSSEKNIRIGVYPQDDLSLKFFVFKINGSVF